MELMFVVVVLTILIAIGVSSFVPSKKAIQPDAISRAMLNTLKAIRMSAISKGVCHRLVLNTSEITIHPDGIGEIGPKTWKVYIGNLFICPSNLWVEESLNDLELAEFRNSQDAGAGIPIVEEVYGVLGNDSMPLDPGQIDLYFLPSGNYTVSYNGTSFNADEIRFCFMNDAEYDTNGKAIPGTEGRSFTQQICLYSFNSMSRSISLDPDQKRGTVSCLNRDGGL